MHDTRKIAVRHQEIQENEQDQTKNLEMTKGCLCFWTCLCHAIYRQVLEPLVVLLLPGTRIGARHPLKLDAEKDSYTKNTASAYWTPMRTLFYRYYCRKLRGELLCIVCVLNSTLH